MCSLMLVTLGGAEKAVECVFQTRNRYDEETLEVKWSR